MRLPACRVICLFCFTFAALVYVLCFDSGMSCLVEMLSCGVLLFSLTCSGHGGVKLKLVEVEHAIGYDEVNTGWT